MVRCCQKNYCCDGVLMSENYPCDGVLMSENYPCDGVLMSEKLSLWWHVVRKLSLWWCVDVRKLSLWWCVDVKTKQILVMVLMSEPYPCDDVNKLCPCDGVTTLINFPWDGVNTQ